MSQYEAEVVASWPLSWPSGTPRTSRFSTRRAPFRPTTLYHEAQRVLEELRLLGVRSADVVISSNYRVRPDGIPYSKQPRVDDVGVAVWFKLKGERRVLACDKWDRAEHNLRAVALHVHAIRGQQRWGVGTIEQAFAGFVALPQQAGGVPWWEYFGLEPDASVEEIRHAYRTSAKYDHPDAGGARERWDELQVMLRAALDAVAARRAS